MTSSSSEVEAVGTSIATANDDSTESSSQGQLDFSRLGLIGRAKEVRILQNAFARLYNASGDHHDMNHHDKNDSSSHSKASTALRTFALISGLSGTGKSALAMHFQPQAMLEQHCFFVSGKFDSQQKDQPYSGIQQALKELVVEQFRDLERNHNNGSSTADERSLPKLRELLLLGFERSELRALSQVIPDVLELLNLNDQTTQKSEQSRELSIEMAPPLSASIKRQHSITSMSSGKMPTATERVGYKEQSDRLKFALRRFIHIVCEFSPLVMVVDDLQWADKASLDLLQSWILDSTISRLLIIGCYRTDLLDESQDLQDTITSIEESKRERSVQVVKLEIGDLSQQSVQEMLIELIAPNKDRDIDELASIVYKKTGGNAFFVQQYLQSLVQDHLIHFDGANAMKWVWNENEIIEKSSATINVVHLTRQKLEKVEAARRVLPIAACMGATFSGSVVFKVIRALSIHSDHSTFFKSLFVDKNKQHQSSSSMLSDSYTSEWLKQCEDEGFIVASHRLSKNGKHHHHIKGRNRKTHKSKSTNNVKGNASRKSDDYSFIHDKIQEAALSLIDEDKLSELQYRVGEVLLTTLTKDELDTKVFAVANLINARMDLMPKGSGCNRLVRITMLNYLAGQKAVACSAFQPALRYFATAISLMTDSFWKTHFNECMDIYSSAAECAAITSDMVQMRDYCLTVVNTPKCSTAHKIRVYHVLIDAAMAEANGGTTDPSDDDITKANSFDLCMFVLKEMNCEFPKQKWRQSFATVTGMMRMKYMASKWTPETFRNMPIITESAQEVSGVMKTLNKMSNAAYLTHPDLVPLITFKRIQRTLKYGISVHSPPCFGFQGLLLGYFMGDFQTGRKLAEIALKMLEMVDGNSTECQTKCLIYCTIWHWTTPIEEVRDCLFDSSRIGMTTGDTEHATWCIYQYLLNCFFSGKPLTELDAQIATYSRVMEDFHQNNLRRLLLIFWQLVQNLRGDSNHQVLLVGDAFDEVSAMQNEEREMDAFRKITMAYNKLFAASYYGDFEKGAKIIMESREGLLKMLAGLAVLLPAMFHGGLCCYMMAASDKVSRVEKAKYLKMAKICRKQLDEWTKKGNPNCQHGLALLNAEQAMRKKKFESAIMYYGKAVETSRSRSFIHDEALASERLAMCLLQQGRAGDARRFFEESIRLNEEWGAKQKAQTQRTKLDQMFRT